MKKAKLLKECASVLQIPKVETWYQKNLHGKNQGETINSLEKAIEENELTIREALSIALIVGVQWDVKFNGVS